MICAARLRSTPRSCSTRAVMPTLVATMAAATNAASCVVSPVIFMNAKPAAKGSRMPATATFIEVRPRRIRSLGLVSRPTVNSRKMAPISAREIMLGLGSMMRAAYGPSTMPARISPSTAGIISRSNTSPNTFAHTKMVNS